MISRSASKRQVDVGERLRLDPLRCIDHQQRALTRLQGTTHLIGEVDVTRGVDQVELVDLSVVRLGSASDAV